MDAPARVQHDSSVTGSPGWRTTGRRTLALGAVAAALSAGCARHAGSVAPPTVPATAPTARVATSVSPAPSPSGPPIAALTGAAGDPLWSRPGRPADRAVTVGDAVVVVEGAPPAGGPTGAAPAGRPTSTAPGGQQASVPLRLVTLTAANGRERVAHRLGDGRPGSVPLRAKTFRRDPVAVSAAAARTETEVAYDTAGRKVWTAPEEHAGLTGDEGEYLLQVRTKAPPAGGPAVNHQRLMTLTGTRIVDYGPYEDHKGDVFFVHDDAAVVKVQGSDVRIATVAARPRTLWSTAKVKPDGFDNAEPVAVIGDDLLVQWTDEARHYLLSLHDYATGELVWRTESLPGGVTRGAVVPDRTSGIAVLGSDGTGPTLGVEIRTGKIRWRLSGDRNFRPVAAWRGRVYGASGDTALVVDARTGQATILGTHVEISGVTSDGVLILRGATGQTTAILWAFKPPRS